MFVLDKNNAKPLYLQLRDQIRLMIVEGMLPPGKLPSTRELAQQMELSRGTVEAAYNYLVDEGLLEVRPGLGTFVLPHSMPNSNPRTESTINWDALVVPSAKRFQHYREQEGTIRHGDRSVISFTSLAPDHHVFSVESFRRALNDALAREGGVLLNYGYARGYEPLRNYLRNYLTSKGLSFEGQDLLIVNGFRQAVELVTRVLVSEGDTVFVEAPTYNGVLGLLKSRGAHIQAIDLDEQGMRADILEQKLKLHHPKMVYCVPSYQNPTGTNMSMERRQAILALCHKHNVLLVEDGFSEELRYEGESFPPIKAMDTADNVVYAGSFSKVLFPGLRIGWLLAPKPLYKYLLNEKYNEDIHTAVLQQAGLYEFLERGGLEKHLRSSRALYRKRMQILLKSLDKYFMDLASWPASSGGFSVFLTFKEELNLNTRDMLKEASQYGVMYVPGNAFFPDGRGANCLRLGFSRLEPEQIVEGIQRLRRLTDSWIAQNHQ